MRSILHVDMDAFYASVEQRDDPSLAGKPVIVGGSMRRGVVSAASYEVRPYGVRSAMSMAEAMRRCPHAVVVPVRMDRYAEVSAVVFGIFRRFTPLVEGLSLDEAFLDVTESRALFGDGVAIATRIKQAIKDETGLTASAGVAPCKFAAKVASDMQKPDGLVIVPEDVAGFLAPLPIERMWGIGPKTAPRLRASGYSTIGDLARAAEGALENALGSWGAYVRDLARGVDARDVEPDRLAKSIGAEVTYDVDLVGRDAIAKTLLEHASRVASRLVGEGFSARTITIKLKRADFTLVTKRTTLDEPVADTDSIFDAACKLLDAVDIRSHGFRLSGVSVSNLTEGPPPRTLFPDARAEKRRTLEKVVARVKDRFDGALLTRASLLDGKSKR